jgi:mono/diheme cytochrome c family protein
MPRWIDGTLAGLTLAAVVVVSQGAGAVTGDDKAGHRLARQWCAECHMVEPPGAVHGRTVTDATTPFAAIARDPAYTAARLRGWLTAPHPPMPDPGLTRHEIDLILDYLRSLK